MPISRLARLTAIITQLQSRRLITAQEIADRYDISVRTVYRDIRSLEEAGIPIMTEEGKGYRLVEGFHVPPLMFSEEEVNALITAEKLIQRNKDQSLIEHFSDALTKIKSLLRETDQEKIELLSERVVFIKNVPSDSTSNYLSTIERAITNYQILHIKYQTGYSHEVNERDIEAQALYHTQDNWVLIAWCHLREDYREFRLDRILSMVQKSENFEPRNFDLMKYFYAQLNP